MINRLNGWRGYLAGLTALALPLVGCATDRLYTADQHEGNKWKPETQLPNGYLTHGDVDLDIGEYSMREKWRRKERPKWRSQIDFEEMKLIVCWMADKNRDRVITEDEWREFWIASPEEGRYYPHYSSIDSEE